MSGFIESLAYEKAIESLKGAREVIAEHKRAIARRDREIEVLTTERDNALLRIEELEREVWGEGLRDGLPYGGVNPNA